MQIRDNITFYTPDKATADAENASGCGIGKVSCDTADADVSVSDVLHAINPLEHIPFVSTLYNELTGTKASAGSQLAGGAIYGGPIGVIFSAISLAFQGETGHDATGAMVASLSGEKTAELASTATQTPQAAEQVADATDTSTDEIVQTPLAEILPPAAKTGKMANMGTGAVNQQQRSQDVLSLFDAPNAAAHSAYRRTQAITQPTSMGVSQVM